MKLTINRSYPDRIIDVSIFCPFDGVFCSIFGHGAELKYTIDLLLFTMVNDSLKCHMRNSVDFGWHTFAQARSRN